MSKENKTQRQAAQLYDISGKKMKLILEFPTIGEPHYASAIAASELKPNVKLFTRLADNHNPYKVMKAQDARVVRTGNRVDIYMATIRSRLVPDNIEGIRLGDEVYVHVTNIEQEWDIPHGFAIKGNTNASPFTTPGLVTTVTAASGRRPRTRKTAGHAPARRLKPSSCTPRMAARTTP